MRDLASAERYTNVAIMLHWLIALLIIANLIGGIVMTSEGVARSLKFSLYQWHKSLGIVVLLLSVSRLLWRLGHRAPSLPQHLKRWERIAAHLSHALLYGFMIGIPLAGWIMVSASTLGIPTVLFGTVPWPHLPMEWVEDRKALAKDAAELHAILAYLMLVLLIVHIGAALKHHFYYRDDVLVRMLPRWEKSL